MSEGQPNTPLLQMLENDVRIIGSYMREFSSYVIGEGISQYPVYVAHLEGIALGKAFMTREQHKLNWSYNISFLEELTAKKIISADKASDFKSTYGAPAERACILVVVEEEANFIFVDYVLKTQE